MRSRIDVRLCALNIHIDIKYEIFLSSCVVGFRVSTSCRHGDSKKNTKYNVNEFYALFVTRTAFQSKVVLSSATNVSLILTITH